MSINFLIQIEADTVTESPVSIPFEFSNKLSIPEGETVTDIIVIEPITVRTYFKLKPLLLSIEKPDFDKLVFREENIVPDSELVEIMAKYDETIFEIICIGIHNSKDNMPLWYREVLKDNSTWKDLFILLNAILYRIGYNPFCKSITTARSVSPLTELELIAAQKNLESWTNQ